MSLLRKLMVANEYLRYEDPETELDVLDEVPLEEEAEEEEKRRLRQERDNSSLDLPKIEVDEEGKESDAGEEMELLRQ